MIDLDYIQDLHSNLVSMMDTLILGALEEPTGSDLRQLRATLMQGTSEVTEAITELHQVLSLLQQLQGTFLYTDLSTKEQLEYNLKLLHREGDDLPIEVGDE